METVAPFFVMLGKAILGAGGGFIIVSIALFLSRWWPTTYVDTRDLPKGSVARINLRLAQWGAAVGLVLSFFF